MQTLPGFPVPNLSESSSPAFYAQVRTSTGFEDQLAKVLENKELKDEAMAVALREMEATLGDISLRLNRAAWAKK